MSSLDNITVSVVIPCYNHCRFLEQRLFSIVNQTFQPSQVIFLDDCSMDDSFQFGSKYLKEHLSPSIELQLIMNERNSGSPFRQWFNGIQRATCDFLWIAESDDVCELTFLEELLTFIMKTGSSIGFSQSIRIDSEGIILGSESHFTQKNFGNKFSCSFSSNDGSAFVSKYGSVANPIPNASAVVMKKHCFVGFNPNNILFNYAGDWYLWLQLIYEHGISYCPKPLNYFRCHSDTTRSVGCGSYRYFAENLACRILALDLCRQSKHLQISKSFFNFFMLKVSYLRLLLLAWQSFLARPGFSPAFMFNVRKYYIGLNCIPISFMTWSILFVLHFFSAPCVIIIPVLKQVRYYIRRIASLVSGCLS